MSESELIKGMRMMAREYQKAHDEAAGLRCKFCGSVNVVYYGRNAKNVQQCFCKRCRRKFSDNKSLPKARSPMAHQAAALSLFYGGMSLKDIRTHLSQEYKNYSVSRSTLERWIDRFSKVAVDEAAKHMPKVGPVWVADETVLRLGGDGKGGRNVWFFDLIDEQTRFLLASHMAFTRTTKAAQTLMEKAYEKAGKAPERIVTDGLRAYQDAIELTFGADSKHVQSKPFTEKDSTNMIERFHSTLKTRTDIMRGLKRPEAARKLLEAWLVHYNFFRPHDALDGKTPAEAAGIKYPFKSWSDVIKSQAFPTKDEYPSEYPDSFIGTQVVQRIRPKRRGIHRVPFPIRRMRRPNTVPGMSRTK
jgi:transposase-like protein